VVAVADRGGKGAGQLGDKAAHGVEARGVVDGDVVVMDAAIDDHDAGRPGRVTWMRLWCCNILDDVFDLYGLFLLFHWKAL